jgi:hypothetical protein
MKDHDVMDEEPIMVPFEDATLAVGGEDALIIVPSVQPVNAPVEIDIDHRSPSWF